MLSDRFLLVYSSILVMWELLMGEFSLCEISDRWFFNGNGAQFRSSWQSDIYWYRRVKII